MFLLLVIAGCGSRETDGNNENKIITISAASSLQNVLEEIAERFEADHPEINIRFNFGASGTLTQQIEQGAPVDLFLSASVEKFGELTKQGLIEAETELVRNELVLIVPKETTLNIADFSDLANEEIGKIAIGTPQVVPAGTYAEQVLQYYNIWDQLQNKIVYAKDVRQVLTYVETGNVKAGIVYQTDALISDQVQIIATAEVDSHELIIYPVGIIKDSPNLEEAKTFYDYLQSDRVDELWIKYGFQVD